MPHLTTEQWQALSPYLDEALDLGDEERSLWLASLRAKNAGVAQQLEMLLREHRVLSDERFLETHPAELPGARGLAGQDFGLYTLISQIGQGGMGSVWLAERNDGRFDRRVAVKALNISLIGNSGEERFKREGSILGRLAHPHIAELLDAGVSAAGQPYIVLEHVDGEPIDRYCDREALTVEARARLFLDVLEAVAHAHANLIVHRDIKPSNVLVRSDGKVKLLDFGIAKLMEEEGRAGATMLTREGGAAMTPEYAAPEQLTGGPVTNATDIYGLGVLAYVLLTGRHPAGSGPHSAADLVNAIVHTDPPRLSDAVAPGGSDRDLAAANAARRGTSPEKLARRLRGDLDTIVAKALKKNPQERYASVKDLAADLDRHLKHEPIRARPDTVGYRSVKFVRRHRRAVIAALFAAVVLTGATTATWLASRRTDALPQYAQRKLTATASELPVFQAAISPDGKYLAYGDREGVHLQLVETGGIQLLPIASRLAPAGAVWVFGSWYPDSTRFLASVVPPGGAASLWSVPIQVGDPQKIADVGEAPDEFKISPDGSKIVYTKQRAGIGFREIWLMGSHGESPHKILTADNNFTYGYVAWSPTGGRIVYSYKLGSRSRPSVLTCDLEGAHQTTVLHGINVNGMAWIPPGRFVYSRTRDGSVDSDDLWELSVDEHTGTARGKVRRLTDWSGFFVSGLSATADGKHLTFIRLTDHGLLYVGDLASSDTRLVNFRRLVQDDNLNIAISWTSDSREVILSAQRATTRLLYKQALGPGSTPQFLTPVQDMNFYLSHSSPDGASLILEGEPARSRQMGIYRLGVNGGILKLLFPVDALVQYWCTNRTANRCVIERSSADKNELIIDSFDATGNPPKELLRIPLEPGSSARVGYDYNWQLSPDGAWIAILKRYENHFRLVPLDGSPARVIETNSPVQLQSLDWAADSRKLFMATRDPGGATLLRVDLNGRVQPIWTQPQAKWMWGIPSPDGRHLTIGTEGIQSNVWMLGNF